MTNNYNAIAGLYDFLSRLIFRNAIIDAQKFLLKQIAAGNHILIVGGGTGWVLEALAKMQSQTNIIYIEKSARMIALSKKRNYKNNTVKFIQAGIEDYATNKQFDVVFTAFLFDNFKTDTIQLIYSKLHQLLKPNGLWLYADFKYSEHSKWWQKCLLKIMYAFFKLTCNIETQQLVNMDDYFAQDYIQINEAFFYKSFIQSKIYRKK